MGSKHHFLCCGYRTNSFFFLNSPCPDFSLSSKNLAALLTLPLVICVPCLRPWEAPDHMQGGHRVWGCLASSQIGRGALTHLPWPCPAARVPGPLNWPPCFPHPHRAPSRTSLTLCLSHKSWLIFRTQIKNYWTIQISKIWCIKIFKEIVLASISPLIKTEIMFN